MECILPFTARWYLEFYADFAGTLAIGLTIGSAGKMDVSRPLLARTVSKQPL